MPSKKQLRRTAFELSVIMFSVVVDVVFVALIEFSAEPLGSQIMFLFQIILPSTIAVAVPLYLQAHNKWSNMPQLGIRYEWHKKSELYELYHHKDVPMNRYSVDMRTGALMPVRDFANYVLIGLKNEGNSTARNCYVKLWIYSDSAFKKSFDNPFTLYWFHDPNSRQGLPPSVFNLSAGDEQFVTICHIEKTTQNFLFDDHGQFTFRRMRKLEELPRVTSSFYIRIIAHCENADPVEKCFKIKKGDYDNLEMQETESKGE